MKKISLICIIFVLFLTTIAFADMGAPEIREYEATPKSVDGAPYYEYVYNEETNSGEYVEVGIIEYGKTIIVLHETIEENGEKYGVTDLVDNHKRYEIKLDDFYAVNDIITEEHDENPTEIRILVNDIQIHNGPAYIYDVVGTIPKDTILNGYRIDNGLMNPWLYIEYNGISGWICELNSSIGYYTDRKLITMCDLSVSGDEIAIPNGTIINGYYDTDDWSSKVFFTYEDKDYLVDKYDFGVEAVDTWFSDGYEIKYDNAKMYSSASLESEVVVDNIPNGTVLSIDYIEYGLRWIGWIYTEYNGVKGWVIYFEDERAQEEFLNGEYNVRDVKQDEMKLIPDNNDVNKVEENNEPKEVPLDRPIALTTTNEKPIVSNTVVYIGIAVIIALTALVIILLVNKKKE